MKNDTLILAGGVVLGLIAVNLYRSASSASSGGDTSIDPSTGGVTLPTPAVYGPPAPIVEGLA